MEEVKQKLDFPDIIEIEILGKAKQRCLVDSTIYGIRYPDVGKAVIYELNNKHYEVITWQDNTDQGDRGQKTVNILFG